MSFTTRDKLSSNRVVRRLDPGASICPRPSSDNLSSPCRTLPSRGVMALAITPLDGSVRQGLDKLSELGLGQIEAPGSSLRTTLLLESLSLVVKDMSQVVEDTSRLIKQGAESLVPSAESEPVQQPLAQLTPVSPVEGSSPVVTRQIEIAAPGSNGKNGSGAAPQSDAHQPARSEEKTR